METKKILVADDEERIVKLVSDFLKMSGYEVLPAADGAAALEAFNKGNSQNKRYSDNYALCPR